MATDKTAPTPADPALTAVLAKMAELLAAQQKKTGDEELNTEEARKAGRRVGPAGAYENAFAPDISAYNPLGERDNPRPELRCQMIWVGYKLVKEALTRAEIELFNQVKAGEYRVTKADGSTIPFKVEGRNDAAGRPELLTFHFPCKSGNDRHNHMPMTAYLREVIAQQTP